MSARCQATTSELTIADSAFSPNVGSMWARKRYAYSSRVRGRRSTCSLNQALAYSPNVTFPLAGTAQEPRTMSASFVASYACASALVLNVSGATCRQPSCQYAGLVTAGRQLADAPEMTTAHARHLSEIAHAARTTLSTRFRSPPYASELLILWWRRWDSNPRPPACKAGALATELRPRVTRRGATSEFIPRASCGRNRALPLPKKRASGPSILSRLLESLDGRGEEIYANGCRVGLEKSRPSRGLPGFLIVAAHGHLRIHSQP